MSDLSRIAAFLDRELRIADFEDTSHNGLQVENSGKVRTVCCGVDASMEFFEAATSRGAGLVICHHGLSWGDSLSRITGMNYRRLGHLLRHDMALYACHLPLDAHPRHGHNAQIARALGIAKARPFGWYSGRMIGAAGALPRPMPLDAFCDRVRAVMGTEPDLMAFGKKTVRTVAIVSGGGADELKEACDKSMDAFLSGEPTLSAYHVARERGINAVFAGHYATEVFGVRAIAGLLGRRFGVAAEFIDLRTPY